MCRGNKWEFKIWSQLWFELVNCDQESIHTLLLWSTFGSAIRGLPAISYHTEKCGEKNDKISTVIEKVSRKKKYYLGQWINMNVIATLKFIRAMSVPLKITLSLWRHVKGNIWRKLTGGHYIALLTRNLCDLVTIMVGLARHVQAKYSTNAAKKIRFWKFFLIRIFLNIAFTNALLIQDMHISLF